VVVAERVPRVNIGVDTRNPSDLGQTGLMEIGFEKRSDFKMVEFAHYGKNLDSVHKTLNGKVGAYTWAIGGRGTGKSEVLTHLFAKQISENKNKSVPRLPLYISVSDEEGRPMGAETGQVDMRTVNTLARKSLLQAFEFIKNHEHPEHYRKLRKLVDNGDFWDWACVELRQENFELGTFLSYLETRNLSRGAFKLALYIDDLDKISTAACITFLSNAQGNIAPLVSNLDVVLLSAVDSDFPNQAYGNPKVNYCYRETSQSERQFTEIRVPYLDELPSSDIHRLIKTRISYLKYDLETEQWNADFKEKPVSIEEVTGSENWQSYLIEDMRSNGSLLTLNAWLSIRDQLDLRSVLENFQAVLNDCDTPRREITPKIIERKLSENSEKSVDLLKTEISKRLKGVNEDALNKESSKLLHRDWKDFREIAQEVSTVGWSSSLMMNLGFGTFSKEEPDSAIARLINLVVEISRDDTCVPLLRSRSPDDIFATISRDVMLLLMEKEVGRIQKARLKKTQKANSKQSKKEATSLKLQASPKTARRKNLADRLYSDVLQSSDSALTAHAMQSLGHIVALSLAKEIGKASTGKDPGTAGQWKEAQKKDPRQFARSILQHVGVRINFQNPEEKALLLSLNQVLSGVSPFALRHSQNKLLPILNRKDPQPLIFSGVQRLLSHFEEGTSSEDVRESPQESSADALTTTVKLESDKEDNISINRPYLKPAMAEEAEDMRIEHKLKFRVSINKEGSQNKFTRSDISNLVTYLCKLDYDIFQAISTFQEQLRQHGTDQFIDLLPPNTVDSLGDWIWYTHAGIGIRPVISIILDLKSFEYEDFVGSLSHILHPPDDYDDTLHLPLALIVQNRKLSVDSHGAWKISGSLRHNMHIGSLTILLDNPAYQIVVQSNEFTREDKGE